MSQTDILVVDDDDHLREVVRYALAREGYGVREAADGRAALDALAEQPADLVVLDVLMPELDGLEVCRELRRTSDVPILFLSSRGEELDKVLGLEMGGDDYLTKPFSPRELVSRIRAVLRRARPAPRQAPGEHAYQCGDIRLDAEQHRVWAGAEEIALTVTEFRILAVLMKRPGRAWDREQLADRAYPDARHVSERTLDSHVRRIRHKFREHELDPVETVHGLGYRLREDPRLP